MLLTLGISPSLISVGKTEGFPCDLDSFIKYHKRTSPKECDI